MLSQIQRWSPYLGTAQCYDAALDIGATDVIRDWLRSSMGVFGCFGICIGLFCLAVWIMWQLMESMGPG